MSNEELAEAIKAGQTDLYPELWNQVFRFVAKQANYRHNVTTGYGGVERDDLIQSGFLALVEAVSYFDPLAEYSFLTVLGNCLKTAFAKAGGYNTSKQDPLNNCSSLDAPLSDDPKSDKWEDLIADERNEIERVENEVFREQLRGTMDAALSSLPVEQMETLYLRFVRGRTFEEIGTAAGVTPQIARAWEYKALSGLRAHRHESGLEQFLDENTNFYTRVSVNDYQRTGQSAVEKLAIMREALAVRFVR